MNPRKLIDHVNQEYLRSPALQDKSDVQEFTDKVVANLLSQPGNTLSLFGPILEGSIREIIAEKIEELLTQRKVKKEELALGFYISNLEKETPNLNGLVGHFLGSLQSIRNRYNHHDPTRNPAADPNVAEECVVKMLHFLVWKYECLQDGKPEQTPRSASDPLLGWGATEMPVIDTFAATPDNLKYGERATLAWVTRGASQVTIELGSDIIFDGAGLPGSKEIRPDRTQSYTLRAFNIDREMQEKTITVTVSQPQNIFIVCDWEDRPTVKCLVQKLRRRGVQILWDQDWPCWRDFTEETRQAIERTDVILHCFTHVTKHSGYCEEMLKLAGLRDRKIVLFDMVHPSRSVEDMVGEIIAIVNPVVQQTEQPKDDRDVSELLKDAFKENLSIPSDTITDKIFVSPTACLLVERAYVKARDGWIVSDEQRIQAYIEYARLKRFQGEWDEAVQVLTSIAELCGHSESYSPIWNLEYGAIVFETGLISQGIDNVRVGLNRLEKRGIDAALVKALRQLGNMLIEQGEWDEAQQHLYMAMYLAAHIRKDGDIAAELLRIDCVRECASLLMRRNQVEESLKMLRRELGRLEDPLLLRAGEHLSGIILYHIGRAYVAHLSDPRTADNYLQKSLAILKKYDNPVRLAFLYENISRAQIGLHPLSDLKEAWRNLEKAKRVRRRCKHLYMIARTEQGLGDLYRKDNNLEAAADAYTSALNTFTRLDKQGERANVLFALGTLHAQKRDWETARDYLEQSKKFFGRLDLMDKMQEVEFELFRLRYHGRLSTDVLEDILARSQESGYTVALNEVGEYTLHQWIRRVTIHDRPNNQPVDIEIGIGDDAAVLGLSAADKYSIVLTTDAAPSSISRSDSLEMARYAAKFSVVHSLSDILAMGGTPTAVLLNLYLTRKAKIEYAMAVITTVREETRRYGAALIGGDLKERVEQSVGCVGIGIVEKGKAIRRNGAKPGHVVAMTLAGMPLELSSRYSEPTPYRKIGRRWAQEILERHGAKHDQQYARFMETNWKNELLFLPFDEMIAGAKTGFIKSAMDTSDGFLACLQIIGHQSGVGFEIDEAMVDEAIDDQVKLIAEKLGYRPAQFLFNAGHDWEIVLTVEESNFSALQKVLQDAGGNLARLGRVCDVNDHELYREGIFLRTRENKRIWIPFFTDEKFVRRSSDDRPLEWEDLRFYIEKGRAL